MTTFIEQYIAQYRANHVHLSKTEEEALRWLDSFAMGHKWLVYFEVVRKCRTQTMPRHARNFQRYCEQVKMNPDQLISEQKKGVDMEDMLLMEAPNIKEYVRGKNQRWVLSNNPIRDNTLHSIQLAVSSFFHTCGTKFSAFPFAEPKQDVPTPTLLEILEMGKNTENYRDRAILWLQEATGFRPSTILDLKWQDFQPTKDVILPNNPEIPICLIIDPSRNKGRAQGGYKNSNTVTFVHDFAWSFIQAYKDIIKPKPTDPLFQTQQPQKGKPIHFLTYNEVDCAVYEAIFKRIRRRAFGKNPDKQFSPNGFRHFYHDCLTNAHIDAVNLLIMGSHAIPNASNPYVGTHPKITDSRVQNIRNDYALALPYLKPYLINNGKVWLPQTPQQQQQTAQEIEKLKARIKELEALANNKINEGSV